MWATIGSLVTAIPTAAQSNAALIAFAIAAVAYITTMWRVSRNRQLLRNLQKVPPRDRLAALELEMGGTRLATGLSPEQWVRTRIHRYYFFSFAVTVVLITYFASLVFIYRDGTADISVDLKQSMGSSPSGVSSGLILPSAHAARFDTDDDKTVNYNYSKQAGRIAIFPELKYLDAQRRGERVNGFSWWRDPFKWDFPSLSIKVVNNTRHNLVLSEVVFRVRKSSVDVRPVFAVVGPSYFGKVNIVNEGWGGITNASVQVAINTMRFGESQSDYQTMPLREIGKDGNWRTDGFTKSGYVQFSIADLLPDALKQCTGDNAYKRECSVSVGVLGQLDYTDQDGNNGSLKFSTVSNLGTPPAGAPMPPSFGYDAFLKAGESNYTKRLSISQQIRQGEGDNFSVRIATDKSASFDFDMDILAANGSVAWTSSISLSIFVPVGGSERGKQSFRLQGKPDLDSLERPLLPNWGRP